MGQIDTGTLTNDLHLLVTFVVQLLMYATPVIYPNSSIPERFHWIIKLNLMTPVVENFHFAFLGGGSVHLLDFLYSFGYMLLVVIVGSVVFNRVEATFMDTM